MKKLMHVKLRKVVVIKKTGSLFISYLTGIFLLIANATLADETESHIYDINAFRQTYLGGGISRVNPTSFSENEFKDGATSSNVQYRFFMHDNWLMGISAGNKNLETRKEDRISFVSFTQDSYRLFRLYHPAWLGIGFKANYLMGLNNESIAFLRGPDQSTPLGVGVGMSGFYLASKNVLLHAEISRWRGTAHNRLHIVEFGIGASFALK